MLMFDGSIEFIVKFFVLLRKSFLIEMFIGLEINDREIKESHGVWERKVRVKIFPFSYWVVNVLLNVINVVFT